MKTLIILFFLCPLYIYCQHPAIEASDKWIEQQGAEILKDYAALLKIPNHASDLPNIRKNADMLKDIFSARGFDMQLLEIENAPPIVYGEKNVPGATRTYCFYVHYDGQPVDPAAWVHPPFQPVLYDHSMDDGGKPIEFPGDSRTIDAEWRIYGRSSSDDKAPLVALWSAMDALKASGLEMTSNVKLFFDGEEESSSPHVMQYLNTHSKLFEDIDVWLLCDGSVFQTGQPQFKFGGRGITSMEITVYGASAPLHSGHYGSWAPVPGNLLAHLLTSMKSEDGKVLIEGFYDTVIPISDYEKQQLSNVPNIDPFLKNELGLVTTEGDGESLFERALIPSLTIRGLSSGNVGEKSRNIIPNKAIATLGVRLVKGNDPNHMLDLIEAHIRKEGWHIVYTEPDMETRRTYPKIVKVERNEEGFPAGKISMDNPNIQPIIEAVKTYIDQNVVLLPSSAGSNRIYQIIFDVLGKPGISVNMVNYDNNQHAANENLRIGNLWYGIRLMALLLAMD